MLLYFFYTDQHQTSAGCSYTYNSHSRIKCKCTAALQKNDIYSCIASILLLFFFFSLLRVHSPSAAALEFDDVNGSGLFEIDEIGKELWVGIVERRKRWWFGSHCRLGF